MKIFKQTRSTRVIISGLVMTLLLASGLLTACTENDPVKNSPTENIPTGNSSVETNSDTEQSSNADKDPASLAKAAVNQAQTKYRTSEQVGYAWAKAKVSLDKATKAFEAGDFETAITEADQSTQLIEISLTQEKAEQSEWPGRFPKISP